MSVSEKTKSSKNGETFFSVASWHVKCLFTCSVYFQLMTHSVSSRLMSAFVKKSHLTLGFMSCCQEPPLINRDLCPSSFLWLFSPTVLYFPTRTPPLSPPLHPLESRVGFARRSRANECRPPCVSSCSDPGQVRDGWEKRHQVTGEQLPEGPRRERGRRV